MESSSGGGNRDLDSLLEVLTQGEDHLVRLDACLAAAQWPAAEQEKQLLLGAQSCVSQAIRMVKEACSGGGLAAAPQQAALGGQHRRELCKKRKTIKKWTSRVHESSLSANNDGYSWRKYGQKKILGAKHPRAYFRCTYKSTAGCQAMKQVQRSNDDPFVFEITYRGEHTCAERLKAPPGVESSSSPSSSRWPGQDQSLLLSFRSLKVESDAGSSMEERERSSFALVSTPASGFSPPFVSPPPTTTPESKSISPSATHAGTAPSELAEVVAAAAPANDQYDPYDPFVLDSCGFEQIFPFDL